MCIYDVNLPRLTENCRKSENLSHRMETENFYMTFPSVSKVNGAALVPQNCVTVEECCRNSASSPLCLCSSQPLLHILFPES